MGAGSPRAPRGPDRWPGHGAADPLRGYAKEILDEGGKLVRTVPRTKKHRKTAAESTRLVLGDPAEVETVRWIFREYLCGWLSPFDLADELNRRGAPRPTARPWNGSTVREILLNPVYVGDVIWNRETSARCVRWLDGALSTNLAVHASQRGGRRIAWARNHPKDHLVLPDRHEPIISREDFALAVRVMKRRGIRDERAFLATRRSFPLGGLLRCAPCDRSLFSRTALVRRRRYRYYYCPSRAHSCRIRAETVEQMVLARLCRDAPGNAGRELARALKEGDRVRAQGFFRALLDHVALDPSRTGLARIRLCKHARRN